MLDKEKILKISELDITRIKQMDDNDLDSFTITVDSFVDGFPRQEESLKRALKDKNRGELSRTLAAVSDILRQIYAEKLAEASANQLKSLDDSQDEDLQTFVIDFLKDVTALSIDLQMAEYQDTPEPLAEIIAGPAPKNTILAVDDKHFFLNAIKTMLQNTGYKATCINAGAAALNYLNKHCPDLFILDIDMPDMDGYELARKIREAGQTAPIIFLTGNANKDYVVKALQAGAADFIVKPITKDQLLERIGRYIKPELAEDV